MRVLVYGGWYGSGNLGDEAILIGVRNLLEEHIPLSSITALSINPERTERVCGVNSLKLQSPRSLMRNRRTYMKTFREAKACIVTGGTPFYDFGHISRIIHMGLPALNSKKLICFGVGSKPITSLKGRKITKVLLGNSHRISARDPHSKSILRKIIKTPITLTGDSALFTDPEVKRTQGSMVLFCPRRLTENNKLLYHEPLNQVTINRIRHMQAKAADEACELGYNVKFIPFHTVPPDDDREEIRVIRNLMENKDTEVLPRPTSPEMALRILSKTGLVVGLRLHSLVLASSCGVPFTTINYDVKIGGFMTHMGLNELNCNLGDGLKSLSNVTRDALHRNQEIETHILRRVKEIRRSIKKETKMTTSAVMNLLEREEPPEHLLQDKQIR